MPTESPIIGRRSVELPTEETLTLGEKLPLEYMNLLSEIRTRSASAEFSEKADHTVYYLYALENNLELIDKQGKKIDTESFSFLMASLPWVAFLHNKYTRNQGVSSGIIRSRREISFGSPQDSFPVWLRNAYEQKAPRATETPKLRNFYSDYTQVFAQAVESRKYGVYAQYPLEVCPPKSDGDKQDAYFKGYIETNEDESVLQAVFQSLREQKIHPHESKIFEENRLVLYWESLPNPPLMQTIENTFQAHAVHFRGPGEDSFSVIRKTNGEKEVRTIASNDQALGDGAHGIDFRQDEYSAVQFMKNYLDQCYRFGRNPLNPYEVVFVSAYDESGGSAVDLARNEQWRVSKPLVPMRSRVPILFPAEK